MKYKKCKRKVPNLAGSPTAERTDSLFIKEKPQVPDTEKLKWDLMLSTIIH